MRLEQRAAPWLGAAFAIAGCVDVPGDVTGADGARPPLDARDVSDTADASPRADMTPASDAVPRDASTGGSDCARSAASPLTTGAVSTDGLVAWWALDGDWSDRHGGHDLVAAAPGGFQTVGSDSVYGPTCDCPGASAPSLTRVPLDDGLTLEGWYWLPPRNTCWWARAEKSVLFGFGVGDDWNQPRLLVLVTYGYLEIRLGNAAGSYTRVDDGGWHHMAVVLPPGYAGGVPAEVYLDGTLERPCVTDHTTEECQRGTCDGLASRGEARCAPVIAPPTAADALLFGSPFGLGRYASMPDGIALDDVRLWQRALSADEIGALGHCGLAPAAAPRQPGRDECAWYGEAEDGHCRTAEPVCTYDGGA